MQHSSQMPLAPENIGEGILPDGLLSRGNSYECCLSIIDIGIDTGFKRGGGIKEGHAFKYNERLKAALLGAVIRPAKAPSSP